MLTHSERDMNRIPKFWFLPTYFSVSLIFMECMLSSCMACLWHNFKLFYSNSLWAGPPTLKAWSPINRGPTWGRLRCCQRYNHYNNFYLRLINSQTVLLVLMLFLRCLCPWMTTVSIGTYLCLTLKMKKLYTWTPSQKKIGWNIGSSTPSWW